VFLTENASKLQAQGVPRDQILASANWAIVENMARSLWNQLELPGEAVVLLHGQTMCSEPLPLAVTHRLQLTAGRWRFLYAPGRPPDFAPGVPYSSTEPAARAAPVRGRQPRAPRVEFRLRVYSEGVNHPN
jgi:hypothetical protein